VTVEVERIEWVVQEATTESRASAATITAMTATVSATALFRLVLGLGLLHLVFTILSLVSLSAMTTMGRAVKVIIAVVIGEQGITVIVGQRRVRRV